MSNEHQPGLTELRINVKGFLACIDKISEDMREVNLKLEQLEQSNSNLISENNLLKQQVQVLNAKLYEHGVR